MIRLAWIATLALLLGACASTAPESTETEIAESRGELIEASEDAMAATDPNELICRREKNTGSRFSTKVCRTRAEIEARQEKDQEALNQIRGGTSGSHCALNQGC